MPDWTIHLLIGASLGKGLRLRNLHVLLLGAVLPDVPVIFGVLSDLDVLRIDSCDWMFALCPVASPFGLVFLCLATALWLSRTWTAFGLLLLGAATHIIADMIQVGHVDLLAYPFSCAKYNWSLHHYGNEALWWGGVAVAALIGLRCLPMVRDIRFDWRKGWLSLLPLLTLAIVIAVNANRFVEESDLNLKLLQGERMQNGEHVVLMSSLVVRENPLTVKKLKCEVEVLWEKPIEEGSLVSVWGTYRDEVIVADRVVILSVTRKIGYSLAGAFLLLLYWVRIPWLDERHARHITRQDRR